MRIHWKLIVITGVWSELLLLAIRIPILRYAGSALPLLGRLNWFASMFLGGLWVARRIKSRFVLHGLLVGIVANMLLILLAPLILLTRSAATGGEPNSGQLSGVLVSFAVKMLGSAAGAYVGGRRRRKLQSEQTGS